MPDELEVLDREDGTRTNESPLKGAASQLREEGIRTPKLVQATIEPAEGAEEEEGQGRAEFGEEDEDERRGERTERREEDDDQRDRGDEDERREDGAEGAEERTEGEERQPEDGYTLEIPTTDYDRRTGQKTEAILQLDGLTQEFRDGMQHHINRSQDLERVQGDMAKLEERLERAEHYSSLVDHALRNGDYGVLVQMEQENPKLGQAFARNWIERHPLETLDMLNKELKMDGASAETIELRAKEAQRKASDAAAQTQHSVRYYSELTNYTRRAERVVGDLVRDHKMTEGDRNTFMRIAHAHLVNVFQDLQGARQNPFLSMKDITAELKPLIERFETPSNGRRRREEDDGEVRRPREDRTTTRRQPRTERPSSELREEARRNRETWQRRMDRGKAARAAGTGATGVSGYLRAGSQVKVKVGAEGPLAATIKAVRAGKV